MAETERRLKGLSVLVVSHRTDLSGPTEALVDFLRGRVHVLGLIIHPFHYCLDRRSHGFLWEQGEVKLDERRVSWPGQEPFIFLKDLLLTLYFLCRFRRRFDLCIGINPFNALLGAWLRRLGLVRKTVLYSIDWMPQRFSQPWLNWLYHRIDGIAVAGCDTAWNLSQPIADVRARQGLPPLRNLYTPVGVDFAAIRQPSREEVLSVGRKRLVLLGALAPSKGVDMVLEAFPRVREQCPQAELLVIGRTPIGASEGGVAFTPYEERLERLGPGVTLMGALPHDEVLRILPTCGISLAPYVVSADNLSNWANPSRVIDSLGAGLPVVLTPVPAIAQEIAAHRAGIVVDGDAGSLAEAILQLLTDVDLYWQMRQNALALAAKYDWSTIFRRALAVTFGLSEPPEPPAVPSYL